MLGWQDLSISRDIRIAFCSKPESLIAVFQIKPNSLAAIPPNDAQPCSKSSGSLSAKCRALNLIRPNLVLDRIS